LQHISSSDEVREKLQDREQFALLHRDRREGGKSNHFIGSDDVLYSSGDDL